MKNNTTFVRVEKNRNYTTIHNEFLKRKDLSWKAKGIMTYLLSLPDDWVVNLDEIKRNATDGESSFRSGWKELVSAGYVSRQPVRDEKTKKIDYWETVIKESVSKEKSHNVENHNVGFHQVGNHKVDNRELLSTKELSTNKQSTNSASRSKLKFETHHLKLAEYLYKEMLRNNPKAKEPNFERWANDFRLMMEQDKRDGKEVQDLIAFSQRHSFWYKNILSPGKMRSQYDRLILEMKGNTNPISVQKGQPIHQLNELTEDDL